MTHSTKRYTFRRGYSAQPRRRLAALLSHVRHGATVGVMEICAMLETDYRTATIYLGHLRGKTGARRWMRIVEWCRPAYGTTPMARYGRGSEPDAPRPHFTMTPEDRVIASRIRLQRETAKPPKPPAPARTLVDAGREIRDRLREQDREAARQRRIREREEAEDKLEAILDQEARAIAASIVPRRDSMIAAFYGPA